jgi:hypothetical protein
MHDRSRDPSGDHWGKAWASRMALRYERMTAPSSSGTSLSGAAAKRVLAPQVGRKGRLAVGLERSALCQSGTKIANKSLRVDGSALQSLCRTRSIWRRGCCFAFGETNRLVEVRWRVSHCRDPYGARWQRACDSRARRHRFGNAQSASRRPGKRGRGCGPSRLCFVWGNWWASPRRPWDTDYVGYKPAPRSGSDA